MLTATQKNDMRNLFFSNGFCCLTTLDWISRIAGKSGRKTTWGFWCCSKIFGDHLPVFFQLQGCHDTKTNWS